MDGRVDGCADVNTERDRVGSSVLAAYLTLHLLSGDTLGLVDTRLVQDTARKAAAGIQAGKDGSCGDAQVDVVLFGHLIGQHREGAAAKAERESHEAVNDAVVTADIVSGLLEGQAGAAAGKAAQATALSAASAACHFKILTHGELVGWLVGEKR